ncbi:uncharacterized protein AMSG_12374 [Thecamonas trahens ATCC 50062]|uniref:Uncharacterized protein n=1 Tax=Thecamonas trahens ATCC 50062 TaxID=461836 RepID=A0A0L0DS04_THETB|nr:hypothetical protein AMSG_12374 [Thecamonas trahens ATCC 50062]KNC55027.1 hypothetical protein AMSG_12374 [Thecamonas trahens ATCC 50062]|eukprot:XP_013753381.1 hypothetical protein AMSG_12374 [Thecamonas trahens ATCC 50062]
MAAASRTGAKLTITGSGSGPSAASSSSSPASVSAFSVSSADCASASASDALSSPHTHGDHAHAPHPHPADDDAMPSAGDAAVVDDAAPAMDDAAAATATDAAAANTDAAAMEDAATDNDAAATDDAAAGPADVIAPASAEALPGLGSDPSPGADTVLAADGGEVESDSLDGEPANDADAAPAEAADPDAPVAGDNRAAAELPHAASAAAVAAGTRPPQSDGAAAALRDEISALRATNATLVETHATQVAALQATAASASDALALTREALEASKSKTSGLESQLEKLRLAAAAEATAYSTQIATRDEQLDALRGKAATLEEESAAAAAAAAARIADLEAALAEQTAATADASAQVAQLTDALATAQTSAADAAATSSSRIAGLEADLESARADAAAKSADNDTARAELASLKDRLLDITTRLANAQSAETALGDEARTLRNDLEATRTSLADATAYGEEQAAAREAAELALASTQASLASARADTEAELAEMRAVVETKEKMIQEVCAGHFWGYDATGRFVGAAANQREAVELARRGWQEVIFYRENALARADAAIAAAPASATALNAVSCFDFTLFKATLVQMRRTDDLITNTLNDLSVGASEPTDDACRKVYNSLKELYDLRRSKIDGCLGELKAEMAALNKELEAYPDDPDLAEDISSIRWKLDALYTEDDVEDITQRRSLDAFRAKCRSFRVPRSRASRERTASKPDPVAYVPKASRFD